MRLGRHIFLAVLAMLGVLVMPPSAGRAADQSPHRQCSPDGQLCFAVALVEGIATYSVERDGRPVILPSS